MAATGSFSVHRAHSLCALRGARQGRRGHSLRETLADLVCPSNRASRVTMTEEKRRNEQQHRWTPYDPDWHPQEVPREYPNSRFIINIRHFRPYDEPSLVLSDFSKPLVAFMRYVYLGPVRPGKLREVQICGREPVLQREARVPGNPVVHRDEGLAPEAGTCCRAPRAVGRRGECEGRRQSRVHGGQQASVAARGDILSPELMLFQRPRPGRHVRHTSPSSWSTSSRSWPT
jgi:hypothetical protein